MPSHNLIYLKPDWPAPPTIHAATSTRAGGVSDGIYSAFNLGLHVGDRPEAVEVNRHLLHQSLSLPEMPLWLTQVHGTAVLVRERRPVHDNPSPMLEYDACYSNHPKTVCAVLTADCLPVLFCSRDGYEIASAHAGWRSLVDGVLVNTVAKFNCGRADVLAWMGPSIGSASYEVGKELHDGFLAKWAMYGTEKVAACFVQQSHNRYLCDLYLLAALQLRALGVTGIYGGGFDTFADPQRFYSFRRDGVTGRMVSLIWR